MSASDLNARYGRTVNRRRRNWVFAIGFGGAIVIVFAAWAIWGGLFVPSASIDTEPVGNSRVSANQILVRWEISENPGTRAKCAVQALDQNFGIVGWKIITIPPSSQSSRTLSTVVRTAQPAFSGLIYLCWPT
ncbi:MAG TPA: DUF4307 domain-containing protein [Galbitalea sp.]|nr:DUF4307 domain-containing protein [Galbitalea sp.]